MKSYIFKKYPALSSRDFLLLWLGQFVSNAGSQMQMVALNWHIYILTNSAVALGLIGLARFVPIVIFSLIGGTVADTHNRKKIMFFTQSILTLLSLTLAIVTFAHKETPLIIYIITILSAATLSFDLPARQAFIPSLVPRHDLANAMSLNVIMFQTSTIAGPAIAGFFIAQLGVGSVYAANALSFVAVLSALFLMKADGHIEEKQTSVSFSSIKEGLTFVKSKSIIWSTMILDFFSTFFASATALLPIFAKDILAVGPQGLGFLYAAPSIGAVIAGYTLAHKGVIHKQGKLLLSAVVIYGFATIVFGLSKIFFLSFLALVFVGLGDGISTIIRNTIRQLNTPDYIRGRITSVNMIFFVGGPQLGEFEAGILAALIGAPIAVAIGGIATIVTVAVISKTIPTLVKYDTHET